MLYFIPEISLLLSPTGLKVGPRVTAVARHFRPSTSRQGQLVQQNDVHTRGFVADLSKDQLELLDTLSSKRRKISVLIAGHTSYVSVVAHVAGAKTVIGSLKK